MSKTPIISVNGGADWSDTVDKLRTDVLDGGRADWIPENETTAETLKATANDTYTASDSSLYGFDIVKVSVKGTKATGTGPDGKTYDVTVDGSGKLVYTEIDV